MTAHVVESSRSRAVIDRPYRSAWAFLIPFGNSGNRLIPHKSAKFCKPICRCTATFVLSLLQPGKGYVAMANLQQASSIDIASLAMRARDAYDQKRTKECLTLTKSLLMADPENAEAKNLQRAIRSDIQRNLDDARALLEDSRRHENLQEHRKAAEILLLKILYLDPEHEEAKVLLNSGKAAAQPAVSLAVPVAPQPVAAAAAPAPAPVTMPRASESVEPVFAVEYRRVEKTPLQK